MTGDETPYELNLKCQASIRCKLAAIMTLGSGPSTRYMYNPTWEAKAAVNRLWSIKKVELKFL